MMSGCAGYSQRLNRPPVPVNLVELCPDVPVFDSNSWDELAEAYVELVFMYMACGIKYKTVVDML